MNDNETLPLPGHGAVKRPDELKVKDHQAGAIPPFDWSQVKEDTVGAVPELFGIADRDQGGSSSCTCQATGYGFAYSAKVEISREDLYSHVHLPNGGAYLNAPLDFLRNNGYLELAKYPDPSPETEQNMTQLITVNDGGRVRTFLLTYKFYDATIDGAAQAITAHSYIHLGIDGSWSNGWNESWIDPAFNKQTDWAHALFAGKESIVLRHGVPAIKAKSSWCQHKDPQGQQVFCHYLNKAYFDNGGVFEVIGVDIAEINMLTEKDVQQLQALEGYSDEAGVAFWTGKLLADYLAARLPDKLAQINKALTTQ